MNLKISMLLKQVRPKAYVLHYSNMHGSPEVLLIYSDIRIDDLPRRKVRCGVWQACGVSKARVITSNVTHAVLYPMDSHSGL